MLTVLPAVAAGEAPLLVRLPCFVAAGAAGAAAAAASGSPLLVRLLHFAAAAAAGDEMPLPAMLLPSAAAGFARTSLLALWRLAAAAPCPSCPSRTLLRTLLIFARGAAAPVAGSAGRTRSAGVAAPAAAMPAARVAAAAAAVLAQGVAGIVSVAAPARRVAAPSAGALYVPEA